MQMTDGGKCNIADSLILHRQDTPKTNCTIRINCYHSVSSGGGTCGQDNQQAQQHQAGNHTRKPMTRWLACLFVVHDCADRLSAHTA